MLSYRVLRTAGAHLRHYHPTHPRLHQPVGFSEIKDNWWRWARYREDGTPRSVLSGVWDTTVVVIVTLGIWINVEKADKLKKDSPILKLVIHLQRLNTEYGKMDLSDTSEAALYLQRLLSPCYEFALQQKDLDLVMFQADEAGPRILQQFATELHTAHGRSGYESLPGDMKPVLNVYLDFLRQRNERREEFLKRLWKQQGTSYNTIG